MQEIIFNVFPWETRAYVFEFGALKNVFVEWADDANVSGNIYEGRVDSISPSLGAAFLDIGAHRKAFLELSKKPQVFLNDKGKSNFQNRTIRVGDRMPVQIISDVSEPKALRVTHEINLVGRYLVFRPLAFIEALDSCARNQDPWLHAREKIRNCEFPDAGFILRSAYDAALTDLVVKEAIILLETWQKVVSKRRALNVPGLLKKNLSLPLRILRDFLKAGDSKILVNNAATFSSLKRFLEERLPHQSKSLKVSSGNSSEFRPKINEILSLAFDSRIKLRSGAEIVIEKTEAMTTIDVNSGSSNITGDPELFAFAVNLEASEEIIKQLCIKNIGGLIVIDLLNMRDLKHQKVIRDVFEREKSKDKKIGRISELSDLGLLALSRRHTSRAISSNFHEPCQICGGTGKTKTPKAVCYEIFGEIVGNQDFFKRKVCVVFVSSLLYRIMSKELNQITIDFFLSLEITIEIKEKASYKKHYYEIVASTPNRIGRR